MSVEENTTNTTENNTKTNSEPLMVAAEILDIIEDILKDSDVLPMSSAHLGSQFARKTSHTIREATGGKGVISLLKDYSTDFDVQGNLITLRGVEPRGSYVVNDSEGKPRGPRRRRMRRTRRGANKPLRRDSAEGEASVVPAAAPAEAVGPRNPRNSRKKKERVKNNKRDRKSVLKAFLVDFDDGCQNFAKGVSNVPIGHSVHLYFPQRLPGSSAPAPPEEAKGFHPHVTETDTNGAVQTAIAVRATQLAIQKRNKVHIYIVSGHVGKYAELIPQVKRLGVTFVTEIDGTKFSLKDMVATNLSEETLLIADELGQHVKLVEKEEMTLRELASFVMSVVGKNDADDESAPSTETELKAELIDRVSMDIKQLARRGIVELESVEGEDSLALEDVTGVREYLSSGRTANAVVKVVPEKIAAAAAAAAEKKKREAEKAQEEEQQNEETKEEQ